MVLFMLDKNESHSEFQEVIKTSIHAERATHHRLPGSWKTRTPLYLSGVLRIRPRVTVLKRVGFGMGRCGGSHHGCA